MTSNTENVHSIVIRSATNESQTNDNETNQINQKQILSEPKENYSEGSVNDTVSGNSSESIKSDTVASKGERSRKIRSAVHENENLALNVVDVNNGTTSERMPPYKGLSAKRDGEVTNTEDIISTKKLLQKANEMKDIIEGKINDLKNDKNLNKLIVQGNNHGTKEYDKSGSIDEIPGYCFILRESL